MIELLQLLSFYDLKEKLFEVVTDNASNNEIMNEELSLAMSRKDISWNKAQNALPYLVHIFNLVTQDFIKALDSEASDTVIKELLDSHIENVEKSVGLSVIIKKIIIQDNAIE